MRILFYCLITLLLLSGTLNLQSLAADDKEKNNSINDTEQIAANNTNAQDLVVQDEESASGTADDEKYNLYIGPYMGMNGYINTVVGHGYKVRPGFSGPDAGLAILAPFGKGSAIGGMLEIGYTKNSYTMYPSDFDVAYYNIKESYNYLLLQPSFYLHGFTLGFTFGFPLSASAINKKDENFNIITLPNGFSINDANLKNYLATRIDVRMGGVIHLYGDQTGKISLHLQAAYNLSGIYKSAENYYFAYEKEENGFRKTEYKSSLNPVPVSLALGVSYLFKVGL